MHKTISEDLYEILARPRQLKFKICAISAKISNLEDCLLPGAIRYDKDKVESSPSDRMPEVMAEIGDLSDKQRRLSQELLQANELIQKMCDERLTDELEKTVILMRFVGCQTFEEIGTALAYDKSGAWRIYDRAMDRLDT